MTFHSRVIAVIALLCAVPMFTTVLSAIVFEALFGSEAATVVGGVVGAACGAAFATAVGSNRFLLTLEDDR